MDEQEEEQQIGIADHDLQWQMMMLDQLANNMSASQVNQYQAQVAAQADKIEMDREMAAALAAEYEVQRNHELALRREMDEEESDEDVEYDAF